MYRLVAAIFVIALWSASSARADDWQWPSQMSIAGFTVTDISGSARSDGSGSANGMLQVPGNKEQRISLARSSSGTVTGEASVNLRDRDGELRGNFKLTNSGLNGRGTLKTASKTISYSSINIRPTGEITGTKSSVVRDQQDTSLAVYYFDGTLSFRGKLDKLAITADGTVRRSGKIANKTTTHRVSNAKVDPSTGKCEVNIGGVNVTFILL